jgi:hypothetical protein
MKPFRLAAIILPLLCTACTGFTISDRATGRRKLHITGNVATLTYKDGDTSLELTGLDNATTTKAAHAGVVSGIRAVSTGVVGALGTGAVQSFITK